MNFHKKEHLSDEQIGQAIRQALSREAETNDRTITAECYIQVTVGEGYVILKGSVESHYERHAVESAVRPISGVRGIINKIQVQPDASFPASRHDVLEVNLASHH